MNSEINFTDRSHTRPSRLYLRKLASPPATILEHLFAHFPQVPPRVWRERVSLGLISLSDGMTLQEDSPYRHGLTVFYRKEVPSEPDPLEEPLIIYRDDEIIVADKPPGMPVTPTGEHVERSLMVRLQRSTGFVDQPLCIGSTGRPRDFSFSPLSKKPEFTTTASLPRR